MSELRPSAALVDPDPRVGERAMLEQFLDFYRAIIVRKLDGVSDTDARAPRTPTGMSLLGLVRHLVGVELWWFVEVLDNVLPEYPWTDEAYELDHDVDWNDLAGSTVAATLDQYDAACELARAVAARFELDDVARHPGAAAQGKTLRWIYVHMIEELARHAGHADIFREQIDGTTGD